MEASVIKPSEIETVIELYNNYQVPMSTYCIGELLHYYGTRKCSLCKRLFPFIDQFQCPCCSQSDHVVRQTIKKEMILFELNRRNGA